MAICLSNSGDRRFGGALCALLHVPGRSRSALLFFPACFHGLDARHCPVRKPGANGLLLGIDQPLFLPADRLLAPQSECTRRRTRSEEHPSELQSLMRLPYAVFCLKNQKPTPPHTTQKQQLLTQHNQQTTPK